jgi:hypothetical protein
MYLRAAFAGVFTARADRRDRGCQDRPTTLSAADHRFAEHASNHGAATPTAAWASADSGSLAYERKRIRPGLDRFEHDPPANLVAQTHRLKIVDDRLFSGFFFLLVNGAPRRSLRLTSFPST